MTADFKGTKEETRALDAYVKLVRASESVTARLQRHLADAGLTVSQFGVLEALHHLGPLSQGELAGKILKSSGNITMVIDNLEKRGLVTRQRKAEDRRFYSVRLTTRGSRVMAGLFPDQAERIVSEMNILTKAEQKQLGNLCRKLRRRDKKT